MDLEQTHPTNQSLEWRGNVPISTRFDDPYYSLDNGLAETRHVFLDGNNLPARFKDGLHIAELGFGTGLNFLTTLLAWRASGCAGRFYFTSFEAYPLSAAQIRAAHEAFPEIATLSGTIDWSRQTITLPDATLTIIPGDARKTLRKWDGMADAWFLDGFSPAKNPQLWEEPLLQAVGDHTLQGGTCATYTAAGFVRRALETAGFNITRVPGFGRKRHMSIGTKR
ncbi:MAG: tRNA (5-methylaminomethyl-2-thiouridine)(34)-methyltransferase MnmD [Planktomarina sp.]